MPTDTPTRNPAFLPVTEGLHPEVAEATVMAIGGYVSAYERRGAEIVYLVLFTDGDHIRTVFDFLPGWNDSEAYGGHDVAGTLVQSSMADAARYVAERYAPAPEVLV
ncbi:MAG TPA: hypothetical protein VK507_24905 [Iamia sp.]|nr:hypothetical protein [Iamia sp.]